MSRACQQCYQADHHRPDCPEMFWPDGTHRSVVPPGAVKPPGPLNPDKKFPLHQESPLSEEMAKIFAGSTERMIERHVKAMRRRLLEEAS